MPDTSVRQLARRIYLEHWQAIDLIIAHKPDWVAEAKQWLKVAVAECPKWKLDAEGRRFVRFRSTDWDRYEVTQTGTAWRPSKSLLLFGFRFDNKRLRFYLGLSAVGKDNSHNRLRQTLFEAVWQQRKLFNPKTTALEDDKMVFLHWEADSILDESDYGVGWDDGATRAKIEAWIARFAENEFPAMNEVIVNCLREYEAEEQR